MSRKEVIALSATGTGKSKLGNALVGRNVFSVSNRPDSETQETVGQDGTFRGQPIHYIDTPGLNDSHGMDCVHVKKMVDYLKSRAHIHGVIIAMNYQDPRLSSSLRNMLKLFCYIFRSSQFAQSVCFLFTHSFRLSENEVSARKVAVVNTFQEIMASAGLPPTPQGTTIPCFFVDNGADTLSSRTESEFEALKNWLSNLAPLRTDLLNHADPQYEKLEEETRQIVVKTEVQPIIETRQKAYTVQVPHEKWDGTVGKWMGKKKTVYTSETRYTPEQVQVGTKTTQFHEEQERVKKTTYSGQVVYTEWKALRAWQTTN